MKVLQLCLSRGKGGLELYHVRTLRRLRDRGIPCYAVVTEGSFVADNLESSGIPFTTLRPWSRYLPLLSAMRLARLVDRLEVDVLHMHWGNDLALAALAKHFSLRKPALVYTRQMSMSRSKRDVYHRMLYGQVDRFIAITKELYGQAVKNLPVPREKVELLYYGVPGAEEVDETRCRAFFDAAGCREGSFKIGLFGRIEYGKGQHVLVEAVRELAARGKDVEALMVGHVMDERYFRSLMKKVEEFGLGDRVRYYGFHARPAEIMGCFDVVLLLTKKETFGLVLIEAMRAGTAVIGTDAGGVREIIDNGETGLLVAPHDPLSLTDALERLVDDPSLRRKLAGAGKEKADSIFSEEGHYARLENIYRVLSGQES